MLALCYTQSLIGRVLLVVSRASQHEAPAVNHISLNSKQNKDILYCYYILILLRVKLSKLLLYYDCDKKKAQLDRHEKQTFC